MLTVCEQQHSISTHEQMFLWKCPSFWDRKCLNLKGTRTPNLSMHAECSYHFSYQGTHLLSHVFEYWLWWCGYFWSKVNVSNANCARATAFIFDTRTDILVKVSKFLRQKISRTPNLRIHAECSNHSGYQGQTFVVPCFWILALTARIFLK